MSDLHPYLRDMLDQSGYDNAPVDDDGDVRIVVRLSDGRSQQVIVSGTPDSVEDWVDFDVWSPIGRYEDMEVKDVMRILSDYKQIGGAVVFGEHLIWKIDVPVGAPMEFFRSAVRICAVTADRYELETEGDAKDQY